MRFLVLALLLSLVLAEVGCDAPGSNSRPKAARPKPGKPKPRKVATVPARKRPPPRPRKRLSLSAVPPEREVLPDIPEATDDPNAGSRADVPSAAARMTNADKAAEKAIMLINASLKDAPTVVVWLIDQSPSAAELRRQVVQVAKKFYQGRSGVTVAEGDEPPLLSAVVAFGEKVNFLVEEVTADHVKIAQALDAVPDDRSGREMGFSAVKAALDRYAKYRRQGREVVFVVATDESGDDESSVEQVLDTPRKYAIPIYVVGPAAPLGRAAAFDQSAEQPSGNKNTRGLFVRQGPESRYAERVAIEFIARASAAAQSIDSGFGPFGWEWLCRASGGHYLAVRSRYTSISLTAGYGWDPTPSSTKQSDIAYPYDKAKMRNYTPDFVTDAQYKKILAENAACNALHQASRLPEVAAMRNPLMEFPAGNEATMKRTLDSAQTEAARLAPDLDRVFETLRRGEKDRDKIRSVRWKASFDLAMGRVLAAKVRIEGYNAMLASLKRGRKFKDAGSMTWVLEPAANIDEAGGKYVTMAKKANEYLNRVVKEHEGTPWAELAKLELKSQIGWKWTER